MESGDICKLNVLVQNTHHHLHVLLIT